MAENLVDSAMENLPVDDTQAADAVSAEELAQGVLNGITVENDGDDSQTEQKPQSHKGEDKSNQIRAALRSQREQIFKDLGASEQEIRDMLRTRRAEEMSKADPEISVKAATEILKAREGSQADRTQEIANDIETLRQDGWTDEELRELAANETILGAMREGKTLRQAVRVYERAQRQSGQQQGKRGVPAVRGTSASGSGNDFADMISDMDDKQFAEFQRRVHRSQMAGRDVRF